MRPPISASAIASWRGRPLRSASVRGRPTTTSTTPQFVDQRRRAAHVLVGPCRRSRQTVSPASPGCRRGSLTATPIADAADVDAQPRPRPGSRLQRTRAIRQPVVGTVTRSAPAYCCAQAASAASIPAGPLPEPCARSALPPPRPSTAHPRLDQVVGAQAEVLRGRVDRHHVRTRSRRHPRRSTPRRRAAAELAADVADERAQVCRRHSAGHPLRHDRTLPICSRACGGIRRGGARVGQPHPVEFLLGDPQPLHEVGHPGRHLVRRHLQR